ncbi:plasmid mobilization relaxosome protein MobC [Porphyromonas levii]|uniref:Plasmid mobilization relaxosome protein MobC n=1 Tax=Porphyromonas levii TaxID=28114 RepID=A0A4Y8WM77_9PORP|nr:plasmid mobilization relaxosome protein MobC [Porphyromonas levii]TFH93838.1 plasmid mobilization relaxosome protein MobC [Porphyromonas levii]TFH96835.1 plasmid mobilization relaxosome protein MobC [Porphyromonas levii]
MEEKTKKMAGKNKRIYMRVTEEEYQMIKDKSGNYPTTTALMVDAVRAFNENSMRNRIATMVEFSSYAKGLDVEMSRVGNNLNQITHELHLYKYGDVELVEVERLQDTLSEVLECNRSILKELRKFASKQRKANKAI